MLDRVGHYVDELLLAQLVRGPEVGDAVGVEQHRVTGTEVVRVDGDLDARQHADQSPVRTDESGRAIAADHDRTRVSTDGGDVPPTTVAEPFERRVHDRA